MGYVMEEYKYTSASGLVSENKELVPGDWPRVARRKFALSLLLQRSEFRTTSPPFLSPTAAAALPSFISWSRSARAP